MHVHRTKFKNHVKLLLRISYRDAGRVRKYTVADLTRWDKASLFELEGLLKLRRWFSAEVRSEIDRNIFGMLLSRVSERKRWRLTSRPGVMQARLLMRAS